MSTEIAALLNPLPVPVDDRDDSEDTHGLQVEATWQERDEIAEGLRICWEEEGVDPLLTTLTRLREERLRLEAEMRLLIAYGRCFTHPRPYKLIDLANAAGMSISGVRTAYDTDEIDQAAEILQRPPSTSRQTAATDS